MAPRASADISPTKKQKRDSMVFMRMRDGAHAVIPKKRALLRRRVGKVNENQNLSE
jgi:hypothetical protein